MVEVVECPVGPSRDVEPKKVPSLAEAIRAIITASRPCLGSGSATVFAAR
jgi:hypothetical protein